ncbi:MAG TPA: DUF4142 domain-containing protein [Dyella sp.]|uniref:DUF4142 domain-containing protein n=1 Tax=Dyella sp. TaxID=1869338 RepID=UPI002D77562B|nr:DUF4142 domain-containing protein [Dyella sp.]HET6553676.1 DUF4142 domain-containing protein [Dyella sp.]
MNRTTSLFATTLLVAISCPLALHAQSAPARQPTQPTSNMDNMRNMDMRDAGTVSSGDQQFFAKASSDGAAEVKMGQLAMQKASSPRTRELAQQLVKDHTQANKELLALAQKKHATAARQAPSSEIMDKLQSLGGADFDKAYLSTMVTAHEEAIDLFTEASHSNDADIKAFATKTLPTLKHHLAMAQALSPSSSPGMP